ncbi:MAG: hypothetical protein GXP62_02620 [Oligoflexia bacterium]|nr:hypothetical protein [Oligoflexia bacterium]
MPRLLLALFLPALGCADYGFTKPSSPATGGDTGVTSSPGDGAATETSTPADGGGSDTGLPPDEEPPGIITEKECEDSGVSVVFSPDEIYVLSWDTTTAEGTLTATESGWFHLYDTSIAESGASQSNESAYIRVANATNPSGAPLFANCGSDYVVVDADNESTPGSERYYIGTFWLDAGDNQLTLNHYCPLYRAGICTELHQPGDTPCDGGDANSVHVKAEGICVQ